MSDEILLNEAAYAVWQTVKERGPIELGEVVKLTGVDQAQVSAAATEARERDFFAVQEREREELVTSEAAESLISNLPEKKAVAHLLSIGREQIQQFIGWANSESVAPNEVFKWGGERGWIERVKGRTGLMVALTDLGKKALVNSDDDEQAIQAALSNGGRIFLDELLEMGINAERVRLLLSKRPELARIKKRTERVVSLTKPAAEAFYSGRLRKIIERNTLTPEDIESGAWREIKLRPYDVSLPAKDVFPAKMHPLRKIIEETRRAFLEMGFAECVSPMIESAFWNFDALFQPQDHPARDMQDTFYLREPAEARLPGVSTEAEKGDGDLLPERPGGCFAQKVPVPFFAADQDGPAMLDVVENVRRTHEDGWTTGSEGWGYSWSHERSKQVVLRTHTTAATIRALAAHPQPPGKFFCVGWTYRNETISFKHLPVFHQVDGIIVDEEANLASLLGTLQAFYAKMGFGRVKFKPAFYPYTEPSVDVVVYMESRGKWLEMGGSGIFRPEVTMPLGCKYPVLAWGLGIERLAMLRFGFDDLRDLYRTNLDALEGVPLWR